MEYHVVRGVSQDGQGESVSRNSGEIGSSEMSKDAMEHPPSDLEAVDSGLLICGSGAAAGALCAAGAAVEAS